MPSNRTITYDNLGNTGRWPALTGQA